jgi:hypothetical protein
VGENKGAAEEGGIVSPLEVRTNPQAMKVTLEDAVSLLSKYVEERTPVLAVFVTPSVSVARVTGTIHISVVDGITPHLIVGKETASPTKSSSDFQIASLRTAIFVTPLLKTSVLTSFEGFLVVASSKGDTLSLFEMKR